MWGLNMCMTGRGGTDQILHRISRYRAGEGREHE